jgi:hypothetical protein
LLTRFCADRVTGLQKKKKKKPQNITNKRIHCRGGGRLSEGNNFNQKNNSPRLGDYHVETVCRGYRHPDLYINVPEINIKLFI